MLQTGTFYTAVNNENSTETKRALANIFIYFSQNGVRKLTTKTDATGKFSFDLPLGDYQVTISQGANFSVYSLAGGAIFSLTSASKVNDFEKWVMTPITIKPEDNPLVIRLAELAKIANDAATEAKAISDQMNGNSVGVGKWMREGGYGVGGQSIVVDPNDDAISKYGGLYVVSALTKNKHSKMLSADPMLVMGLNRNKAQISVLSSQKTIGLFYERNGILQKEVTLLSDANITVDSNGNIKSASPIIKLFNDHIESNDSFKEKPVFEKLGIGVYKISNTLGLAKDGWYIEVPRDRNGLPYFLVDWEQDEESHDVIIRVFKKKLDLETLDFVNGEPVDIDEEQRWIDLRFHEEPEEHHEEELLAEY